LAADPVLVCEAELTIQAHVGLKAQLNASAAATREEPGLLVTLSEIDSASCNGAYAYGTPGFDRLQQAIETLRDHGRPFHVNIRSRHRHLYEEELIRIGFSIVANLPLMVVRPDMFRPMSCPAELNIRLLQPGEDHHLPLVAQGLGMSIEALEPAMSAANRATSDWSGYAGEVDGELAVTGTAIASPEGAGLISIVADPRFGRRGFGGALTSVAVADAFARGIPRVFLHASAEGLSLYERLGFETLESLLVFGRGED
jgi:ribosomal protein S18 acetylase RimI-like enzyme